MAEIRQAHWALNVDPWCPGPLFRAQNDIYWIDKPWYGRKAPIWSNSAAGYLAGNISDTEGKELQKIRRQIFRNQVPGYEPHPSPCCIYMLRLSSHIYSLQRRSLDGQVRYQYHIIKLVPSRFETISTLIPGLQWALRYWYALHYIDSGRKRNNLIQQKES